MMFLANVPLRLMVAIHRASSADTVRALRARFHSRCMDWVHLPLTSAGGRLDLHNFFLEVLVHEAAATEFREAFLRATAHEAPFSRAEIQGFQNSNSKLFQRGLANKTTVSLTA